MTMRKFIIVLSALLLSVAGFSQDAPAPDSSLQQYTGKYKFPEGSVVAEISVIIDGGGLVMTAPMGSSPLEKKEEDVFFITQFEGTAKFNRDASRKVTGVIINAMGFVLEGTRTEGGLVWVIRMNPAALLSEKRSR